MVARGIQKLVSTYDLPETRGQIQFPGGGHVLQKLKVPRSDQIFIFRGGGGIPDQLKHRWPRSAQIFMGGGGYSSTTEPQSAKIFPKFSFSGGRYSGPTFLKYLSGGTQGIFNTNLSYCS